MYFLSGQEVYYGKMAEWTKAADCKSVSITLVGSNPTLFKLKIYYLSKSINFYDKKFEIRNYYTKKLKLVEMLITKNKIVWKKLFVFKTKLYNSYLLFWKNFINTYKIYKIFLYNYINFFKKTIVIVKKNKKVKNIFTLWINYLKNKFKIYLTTENPKHNYFFLTPGFFIKKKMQKKNAKKNKIIKFLMMVLLRKILILVSISSIKIKTKGHLFNFSSLLHFLLQKTEHTFTNPLTLENFNEDFFQNNVIKIFSIQLYRTFKNKNIKERKKGRLKRKIFRKITNKNNLID